MLDPEELIKEIEADNSLEGWRVFRGIADNSVSIALFIVALGLIIAGLFLCTPLLGSVFYLITGYLALLVTIIFIIAVRREASKGRAVLVIGSDIVVEWPDVKDPERRYVIDFLSIDKIELAEKMEVSGFSDYVSSNIDYWLDLYYKDGRYSKWGLENYFGDKASVGKTIIATFNIYKRDSDN